MNKKGFTLVELLAIILLLTILVVLVISNVSTPLDSSNSTINNSKISVLLSAAKNYAEDNINNFGSCTYNTTLQNARNCLISTRQLIDGGYIEEEDIEGLDDSYGIIACYNTDNTTIQTYYKERTNINCNDLEIHRLHLDPQIVSVYYEDSVTVTSSISTTGNFLSLTCEVSPDNLAWSTWATCTISSDLKTLSVHFLGQSNSEFDYTS